MSIIEFTFLNDWNERNDGGTTKPPYLYTNFAKPNNLTFFLLGSLKNNNELNNFIEYLENLANKQYSDESFFLGNINNYLLNQLNMY